MARATNQVQNFRQSVKHLLDAIEKARGDALTIDFLGGVAFYRDELQKVDAAGQPVYDITPANFTAAITAISAITALLEADSQLYGKSLARMED